MKSLDFVFTLVLGQILSLCLTGTAISSRYLQNENINLPLLQLFSTYFLMMLVYGMLSLRRYFKQRSVMSIQDDELYESTDTIPLNRLASASQNQESWLDMKFIWAMIILALLDVEANYLLTSAYRYTSIVSVSILDAWAIPVVMIGGYFLFKNTPNTNYHLSFSRPNCRSESLVPRLSECGNGWGKVLGVMLSISGFVVCILEDSKNSTTDSVASDPTRGNIYVIIGASL